MKVLISVTLLVALCALALADTPGHCLYDQVRGTWNFGMGAGGHTNSLNCSQPFSVQQNYQVTLYFPDVAVDQDGNFGFWTMIYDQGFEVQINGMKFFAFSYFTVDGSGNVTSFCDSTFPGWYHSFGGSNWGCYTGKKASAVEPVSVPLPASKTHSADAVYQPDREFVRRLNKAQNLWTATEYSELHGQRITDIQRRAGTPVRGHVAETKPQTQARRLNTLRDFVHANRIPHKRVDEIPHVDKLPKSFDWRNVSGENFVSPVRNQGQCGSCYAFASMGLIEARLRVRSHNQVQAILSPQDAVSCSEYSQGCNGGFPYLTAGKYGEDFGIVEESCFPYTATDSTPCSAKCTNGKRYYTTDYYYIGGFYGASNEPLMMKEILENGPIAVSFEVYPDFHNYKGGVYHHVDEVSTFNPFEITNHVVVIVGWGETDNGVKYWIVKNSWSETWGENGYFRIMRGNDECSIESITVAVTPVI